MSKQHIHKDYIRNLTDKQSAKWLAIFEAVNIITYHAEKKEGFKPSSLSKYLKPLHIEKYMNERYFSILKDLEYEKKNN